MSISRVNAFGQIVLDHLFQSQNYTGNIAFSSPSLYVMMSIISAGLGKTTRPIISRLLGFDAYEFQYTPLWSNTGVGFLLSRIDAEIKSTITAESVMFHSFNISSRFMSGSENLIGLKYHKCNFFNIEKMTRKINIWAGKNTRGSIPNLYRHPLDNDTNMIVITTLYFFVDWLTPFNSQKTRNEKFTDDEGQELNVRMMKQVKSYKIKMDRFHNISVIFIPMAKSGLYATIVLPRVGNSIKEVQKRIKWNKFRSYYTRAVNYYAELKLPRFKIITKNKLIKTFMHLNASELFDPRVADFDFTTSKNVSINDWMQLTTVVVDELSTAPNIEDEPERSRRSVPYKFHVDRPFLFMLYSSHSAEVLLSVLVTNPNEN
ncbi:Protein Z-dependent protease inhibitor [Thelohanellus kitauei]|uniref:Protein Z-dependent protease inhibitor n=1 Tax=Thelohanellus kitauei TaxID=669202 RepID=A0A0C2N604_THEKT|nr:Protein Z-dependent protease inhibitor [Thelohanellus kitauei]